MSRQDNRYARHNMAALAAICAAVIGRIVGNMWVTVWLLVFGACLLYAAFTFVEDLRDEITQSMRDANDEFERLMSQREDD